MISSKAGIEGEKQCRKCKEVKPSSEFHRKKAAKDGLQSQCKPCIKAYQQADKEAIKERHAVYYQANKEAYIAKGVEYARKRRASDPLFKLTHNTRILIGQSFRNNGYSKGSKTAEILGCSFEEFKEHLESMFTEGMNWGNQGKWHLDHIIPLAEADNEHELMVLNHYSNLQPLWAEENLKKSSKTSY